MSSTKRVVKPRATRSPRADDRIGWPTSNPVNDADSTGSSPAVLGEPGAPEGMPALVAEMRDLEERIALHRKAIAAVCDSMVRVVSQYGEADSVAAPLTEPRDRVAEELAALRSDFDLVESLQREVVQLRGEVQRRDTLGPAIHGLIQATDYLETAAREIRSVPGLGESAEAVTAVASVAYRRLLEVLLRFGVRRVRTRRGDAFDPALHEIAQSRPSEDPAWVGRIAAVIKPAFVDGTGRVERHALVDVYVGC